MNMSKRVLVVMMALPLLVGSVAYADGGHRDGGHYGGKGGSACGMHGAMEQLNLTDEQKAEMKALRQSGKERMYAKGSDDNRKAHHEKVDKLIMAEQFDEAQAQEIADEMASMHSQRIVQRFANQHQMMSILTPEQKEKWLELKQGKDSMECDRKKGRDKHHHDMRKKHG